MNVKGFTFAEIMVASVISIMLIGALYVLSLSGQRAFDEGEIKLQLQESTRLGVSSMANELRQSSPANIITTIFPSDEIRFRVVIGVNAGSAIWGVDGVAANFIQYKLEGARIMRRVFNNLLAEQGTVRAITNNITGFTITKNNDKINFSLTAGKSSLQGRAFTFTDTVEVTLRNG